MAVVKRVLQLNGNTLLLICFACGISLILTIFDIRIVVESGVHARILVDNT